jgi:sialate O-acetylesterase
MVLQQQSGTPIWGWAKEGVNVSVITSWDKKHYNAKTDSNGKWKLKVLTPSAGGPYNITINDGEPVVLNNVLIGEVWLCSGQSNMEMPMKGYNGQPVLGSNIAILKSKNKNIRLFTVGHAAKTEPQNDCSGAWEEASPETVANFSATAYYFGMLLNETLDVPVGLINISFGGSSIETWMTASSLKPFDKIRIPQTGDSISGYRSPTVLYNGMLSPAVGYGIKGCIWYQGEGNYDKPDAYEKLLPAMVREWRSLWKLGDFPFYYAQIAPYNYSIFTPDNRPQKYNSAYLRDAQRKALNAIPNSGMAVLLDVGEENLIHPANKEAAGTRLAYLALAKTYGLKGFGYASPALDAMTIKGSTAILTFKDATNGLTSYGKILSYFETAGPDKKFYAAKAVINKGVVSVSAPEVKEPVAVRYAFKDFVVGDLFSTEGLPVSSFRTDDW